MTRQLNPLRMVEGNNPLAFVTPDVDFRPQPIEPSTTESTPADTGEFWDAIAEKIETPAADTGSEADAKPRRAAAPE